MTDFQKELDNLLVELMKEICPELPFYPESADESSALSKAQQSINNLLSDVIMTQPTWEKSTMIEAADLLEQLGLTGGSK